MNINSTKRALLKILGIVQTPEIITDAAAYLQEKVKSQLRRSTRVSFSTKEILDILNTEFKGYKQPAHGCLQEPDLFKMVRIAHHNLFQKGIVIFMDTDGVIALKPRLK